MQRLENGKTIWNKNKVDSVLSYFANNVRISRLNEKGGYLKNDDFRYKISHLHPHSRMYIGSWQMYRAMLFLLQFSEDNDLSVGQPQVRKIGKRIFYNSDFAKTFNKLMAQYGY